MNPSTANSEGATGTTALLVHAGFWIRVVAGAIDFVLLLIPFCVVVSFAAAGLGVWNDFFFRLRPGQALPERLAQDGPLLVTIGIAAFVLCGWLYFALSESSAWRGTLGKYSLGLYVGDERGEPIDFWQATRRFAFGRLLLHVPWVGGYYFLIDCLCIATLARNRALHDVVSHCLVLRASGLQGQR